MDGSRTGCPASSSNDIVIGREFGQEKKTYVRMWKTLLIERREPKDKVEKPAKENRKEEKYTRKGETSWIVFHGQNDEDTSKQIDSIVANLLQKMKKCV